jgi:hypothetical protein
MPTHTPATSTSPLTAPIQPNTQSNVGFSLTWEQIALVVALIVIATLAAALVVSRRKRLN